MSNPRVLKAHREAVVDTLGAPAVAALSTLLKTSTEVLVEELAFNVLSATDDNTKYVVIVRESDDRGVTVYGPYSADGANKAIEQGDATPLAFQGARLGVFPLTPAPRRRRVKKNGSNT